MGSDGGEATTPSDPEVTLLVLTLERIALLLSAAHLVLGALSVPYFHRMTDVGGDAVTLTALAVIAPAFVTRHVREKRTREVNAAAPVRRQAVLNMYLSEAAALLLVLLYTLALGSSFTI